MTVTLNDCAVKENVVKIQTKIDANKITYKIFSTNFNYQINLKSIILFPEPQIYVKLGGE